MVAKVVGFLQKSANCRENQQISANKHVIFCKNHVNILFSNFRAPGPQAYSKSPNFQIFRIRLKPKRVNMAYRFAATYTGIIGVIQGGNLGMKENGYYRDHRGYVRALCD